MPEVVTHFTNNIRNADKINNRLKPKAFIHPDKSEISVVDIDWELKQDNADKVIFSIGDLIYTGEQKVKARGDMNVLEIEAIAYGIEKKKIFLKHAPVPKIPKHYNIKPDFVDLEFANVCSHNLSIISKLVIKDI
jgi:hypothetical protein